MAHLIEKDALVAEIDERAKTWKEYYDEMHDAECHELASGAYLRMCELKDFKKFLDALEVKEVDLEKEATRFVQTKEFAECEGSPVLCIAEHFFELGLKAKQG